MNSVIQTAVFVMQIGERSGTDPHQALASREWRHSCRGFLSFSSQKVFFTVDSFNCLVSPPAAAFLWIKSQMCLVDHCGAAGPRLVHSK